VPLQLSTTDRANELLGVVITTPTLCSGGFGFESLLGGRLP
jgi:hypothetical protein